MRDDAQLFVSTGRSNFVVVLGVEAKYVLTANKTANETNLSSGTLYVVIPTNVIRKYSTASHYNYTKQHTTFSKLIK